MLNHTCKLYLSLYSTSQTNIFVAKKIRSKPFRDMEKEYLHYLLPSIFCVRRMSSPVYSGTSIYAVTSNHTIYNSNMLPKLFYENSANSSDLLALTKGSIFVKIKFRRVNKWYQNGSLFDSLKDDLACLLASIRSATPVNRYILCKNPSPVTG